MKHNGTGALILRYTRGCKGFFVVTFLLLVGDMASHLLPPFFQQVFTDNIITRKNPEWFGPLMFFYILLFCRYNLSADCPLIAETAVIRAALVRNENTYV